MLLELGDAHIAEVRFQQLVFDALGLDHRARQREHQGLGFSFAGDGQRDLGARLAAHFLHRVGQRQAAHRGVVDLDDQVAALDAGLLRRGVLDGRHHLDQAVLGADFDAEAAEFALSAFLEFLERFRIHVVGVRVQAGQHALDGRGDQLLVFHRVDVVLLDAAKHFGEGAQLAQRQRGFALVGKGLHAERQHAAGHGAGH